MESLFAAVVDAFESDTEDSFYTASEFSGQSGTMVTIFPSYNDIITATRGVASPFDVVDIETQIVGPLLQTFLIRGSSLTGVPYEDINTSVSEIPAHEDCSLYTLLAAGMKLFDALAWISIAPERRPELVVDPQMTPERKVPLGRIASSLFYVYFMLLTQARYPDHAPAQAPLPAGGAAVQGAFARPRVPAFLVNIMGLREDQSFYMTNICTFNPRLFDPRWIRNVDVSRMGQEAMTRFGLGVAGYRMFAPFGSYPCRADAVAEAKTAYSIARVVAMSPPTWNVHPITRDPALLAGRGNLNKNLSNLMLACFTAEQLTEMAALRMIFAVPIPDVNHNNWRNWSIVMTDFAGPPVFPNAGGLIPIEPVP